MAGQVPSRHALTLLVHCDLDPATAARTALAIDLARRTQAHLIGVAAGAPRRIAEDKLREALRRAADDFEGRTAEVARANFRSSALKSPEAFLAEEAVRADLVIVGPQGSGSGGPLSLDTAALVTSTGRPVLIAPEGLDRLDLRRAVVAWKAARESRRALLDGLPWLAMTEAVRILHIVEQPDERPEDDHLEAVRDWLASRVARVEAVRRPGRLELDSVADDILDDAESFGAGLVVAGAYSRAPISERLFGGVTREFLKRGRPARLLCH
jgi:nucleotide-binding universal stress UspA family protein